jgi:hypothetical protein
MIKEHTVRVFRANAQRAGGRLDKDKINRYTPLFWNNRFFMDEDEDGAYILYQDAVTYMDELEEELARIKIWFNMRDANIEIHNGGIVLFGEGWIDA